MKALVRFTGHVLLAMVKGFVRNGAYVMPRFRKTEISDPELDALAAYLTRKK